MKDIFMTRYHLMLDYQTKIAPFTPTFKELLDVWRVATISAVNYTLNWWSAGW